MMKQKEDNKFRYSETYGGDFGQCLDSYRKKAKAVLEFTDRKKHAVLLLASLSPGIKPNRNSVEEDEI